MKAFLNNRDNGFHQRNRRSHCSQRYQQEEYDTDNLTTDHIMEYVGQCNKHQTGTGIQRTLVTAGKHEHCRNNNQTGQKGNCRIKYFDLPDRTFDAVLFSHIRTIGNHDAHCQRHGVKQLSNCRNDSLDGEFAEIRLDIIDQTIYCTRKCQRIDADADDQNQQQRHHKLADFFDSLLYAQHNDHCSQRNKNAKEKHRRTCMADKIGEVGAIAGSAFSGTGNECR